MRGHLDFASAPLVLAICCGYLTWIIVGVVPTIFPWYIGGPLLLFFTLGTLLAGGIAWRDLRR